MITCIYLERQASGVMTQCVECLTLKPFKIIYLRPSVFLINIRFSEDIRTIWERSFKMKRSFTFMNKFLKPTAKLLQCKVSQKPGGVDFKL